MEPKKEELEDQNELLRRQLSELMGTDKELGALMALKHGMTHTLAQMLHILVKRAPAVISRGTFHTLMYGDRSDGGPEPKIFDVRIARIRACLKKIKCPGKIETVWYAGYRADPDLVKWVRDIYSKIPKE
jgi:DNA-binding response OmpR family regulator